LAISNLPSIDFWRSVKSEYEPYSKREFTNKNTVRFLNFMRLPTYGFAHAKFKKSNFYPKILEFLGDIGIILNDFQSWFYTAIKIWVKLTLIENREFSDIQPIHCPVSMTYREIRRTWPKMKGLWFGLTMTRNFRFKDLVFKVILNDKLSGMRFVERTFKLVIIIATDSYSIQLITEFFEIFQNFR